MKRVVVDERLLLLQVGDHARGRAAHLPHRRHRPRDQNQERPDADHVGVQVLLGNAVFALAAGAVDDGDAVRLRRRSHPAGEPAGHPHQVRAVQLVVTALVQASPPGPEPTR